MPRPRWCPRRLCPTVPKHCNMPLDWSRRWDPACIESPSHTVLWPCYSFYPRMLCFRRLLTLRHSPSVPAPGIRRKAPASSRIPYLLRERFDRILVYLWQFLLRFGLHGRLQLFTCGFTQWMTPRKTVRYPPASPSCDCAASFAASACSFSLLALRLSFLLTLRSSACFFSFREFVI